MLSSSTSSNYKTECCPCNHGNTIGQNCVVADVERKRKKQKTYNACAIEIS